MHGKTGPVRCGDQKGFLFCSTFSYFFPCLSSNVCGPTYLPAYLPKAYFQNTCFTNIAEELTGPTKSITGVILHLQVYLTRTETWADPICNSLEWTDEMLHLHSHVVHNGVDDLHLQPQVVPRQVVDIASCQQQQWVRSTSESKPKRKSHDLIFWDEIGSPLETETQ